MKFSLARFPGFPSPRLLGFLVATLLSPHVSAQVVEIPDTNLESAIRETLNIPDNTPITQQEILQLMTLDIRGSSIANLTGLEYAVNLKVLYSMNNQITDISPLANLTNLTHLYLGDNALQTIEPLAGLIHLRVLDLYNAGVKDITPLANLTALESLVIVRNMIVDISPLVGLKNLKRLQLAETPIQDFTLLLELEGVELDLDIDVSQLDQLNLVVTIPDSNLERAIRETLALPDEIPLTQLEMLRLTELKAWQRDITDLTGLQYATNLERLALWGNQIANLSPLANLTKLKELNLAYNAVESVEPIAGLINLQTLNLTINRVQDITPLASLTNLEFLYIREWDQTPTEPAEGLATSLAGNLEKALQLFQFRTAQNSNMVFMRGLEWRVYFEDKKLPPGSDFWLRDENGEILRSLAGSPQLNFLKPEVQDLIAKRIVAVERCGLYDGVMLDQFANHSVFGWHLDFASEEEIIQAILNIFRSVREQVRDDFLIMINANRSKATRYAEYVNGSVMELGYDFFDGYVHDRYTHRGLKGIESTLSWNEENLRLPRLNSVEGWGIPTEPPDSPDNLRQIRMITTLSLTHSNGCVMYNTGKSNHDHI